MNSNLYASDAAERQKMREVLRAMAKEVQSGNDMGAAKVRNSEAEDAEMPAVGSYKTGRVYSDGKPQRAMSYSIGKQTMMSLPARLNGGRVPDLDECADILAGKSINLAPRVDLSKPDVPPHVASVAEHPQEPNAVLLERMRAGLAERRTTSASVFDLMQERRAATVPAVVDDGEPGDPCPGCAACLHAGQDMCDDCRQDAPEVRNLYMCPMCKHEWSDVWTEATSEQCPSCGIANVAPYDVE